MQRQPNKDPTTSWEFTSPILVGVRGRKSKITQFLDLSIFDLAIVVLVRPRVLLFHLRFSHTLTNLTAQLMN